MNHFWSHRWINWSKMSVKCFIFHSRNFWLLPPGEIQPNPSPLWCKTGKMWNGFKNGNPAPLILSGICFLWESFLLQAWSLQRLHLNHKCLQVLVSSGVIKPGDNDFDPGPLQGVAPLTSATRSRTAYCGTSPGFWLAPETPETLWGQFPHCLILTDQRSAATEHAQWKPC